MKFVSIRKFRFDFLYYNSPNILMNKKILIFLATKQQPNSITTLQKGFVHSNDAFIPELRRIAYAVRCNDKAFCALTNSFLATLNLDVFNETASPAFFRKNCQYLYQIYYGLRQNESVVS